MVAFGAKDTPVTKEAAVPSSLKDRLSNFVVTPDRLYKTSATKLTKQLQTFRDVVFDKLINQIDLATAAKLQRHEIKREVEAFIFNFTEEQKTRVSLNEQQQVAEDIVNDMVGLGPLEVLINDDSINDILVNAYDKIFVERFGQLYMTDVSFRNDRHVVQVAQRIANSIGRRIDEASPMVDARLKDGSRVNIIFPPLTLDGVSISIRKFSKVSISLDDMVSIKSMSQEIRDFLSLAAKCRLNILVAGGTGAGKTTLLNAMSQLIDPTERIVTIEDSAELKLQQPHVVRLESRPPNLEGKGEITIRDLLKNALRMRPDRIVVGECRGGEVFDMLQAMNTGHDGSMSTVHANNAQEAFTRLENMLLMTGHELPASVARHYIADAVDLIVYVARMRDGRRRITQVTEVLGVVDGHIQSQDIFTFEYESMDAKGLIHGTFHCHTTEPSLSKKIRLFGLEDQLTQVLKDARL